MQQVQIHNEEETVEISRAEFEALKALGPAIAEQNASVQDALKTLIERQQAEAENLAAMFGSLVEAIKGIQININVPEQTIPAPVVNLPAPVIDVKPPQVKLTVPKVLRTKEKISRKDGLADTAIVEYEYEK